jgi:hypothetical protein
VILKQIYTVCNSVALCHRMSTNLLRCDCCYCDVPEDMSLSCAGQALHKFCFECVCSYMTSGINNGLLNFNCLLKRACVGRLITSDIARLIDSARIAFESETVQRNAPRIGNIVECSTCNTSIRKLAFYNYVSCACGTVVCYECEQDITQSIHKHPCGPTNRDREPRLRKESKSSDTRPRVSRRYRTHSMQVPDTIPTTEANRPLQNMDYDGEETVDYYEPPGLDSPRSLIIRTTSRERHMR